MHRGATFSFMHLIWIALNCRFTRKGLYCGVVTLSLHCPLAEHHSLCPGWLMFPLWIDRSFESDLCMHMYNLFSPPPPPPPPITCNHLITLIAWYTSFYSIDIGQVKFYWYWTQKKITSMSHQGSHRNGTILCHFSKTVAESEEQQQNCFKVQVQAR